LIRPLQTPFIAINRYDDRIVEATVSTFGFI
jgi:hypothetical protein